MKKVLRRSLIILIFILFFLSLKSNAAVTVEAKQEYRQDAFLTIKSTDSIENIKIYKQTGNDRFVLFYKATPKVNETVCRFSSKLLSE